MKYILLVIAIFFILQVSAVNTSDCEDVYYYIIDNLDQNNEIVFNNDSYTNLLSNIELNETLLNSLISNFSECESITSFKLPVPTKDIGFIKNDIDYECNTELNKTILSIDMDSFVGIGSGMVFNMSCKSVSSWKALFYYEQTGKNIFILKGFRLWIIWATVLFIIFVLFIKVCINYITESRQVMKIYKNMKQ